MNDYYEGIAVRQSTKAQIQLGEIVAVLIIFLIIMIFGLYWYATGSAQSEQGVLAGMNRMELLEIGRVIMNLPELECSIDSRRELSCIDEYRARALASIIEGTAQERAYFTNKFFAERRANYKATIEVIHPVGNQITLFDFVSENPISTQQISIPITLYDPIHRTHAFAMLILTQETRT